MRIRALALICSFSVILSTVLAGCGGGGGGSDAPGAGAEDTSDAATRQALQVTNLNVGPTGGGALKRWSLPIPVKTNNVPRATQAMNAIEGRLGVTVFDRTSIAGEPDDSINRGLIVSVGTAPQTSICGAADPGDGASNEISAKIFIHLDSAACIASQDATTHEFGHALGMYNHFQNFGNGAPIGELFWRVLRTIYSNPVGTPAANVVLAP
jgi:hypothetical protein